MWSTNGKVEHETLIVRFIARMTLRASGMINIADRCACVCSRSYLHATALPWYPLQLDTEI